MTSPFISQSDRASALGLYGRCILAFAHYAVDALSFIDNEEKY